MVFSTPASMVEGKTNADEGSIGLVSLAMGIDEGGNKLGANKLIGLILIGM